MNSGAKDQTEGTFHEVKGRIKESIGKVVKDPDLKAEGKSEHLAGKIQKKTGKIKEVFEK